MKKQLVAREQEITAVQARMQASYREHVKEVQQLQGKVGSGRGARSGARVGPGRHRRTPGAADAGFRTWCGFGGKGCFIWPALVSPPCVCFLSTTRKIENIF